MRSEPILEAFQHLAAADPAAPLVVTSCRAASRGDVLAAARALEARLLEAAAPPGTLALLTARNGAGFLAALLACRRAGLVPVLADATTPPAERQRIGEALGASVAVACDVVIPEHSDEIRIDPLPGRGEAPGADYVKMTSGSTGAPLGVGITAEALSADDDQLRSTMGLSAGDRFLAAIPWSHSYGLSSLVLPALKRGSPLVVPDDGGPWASLDAARTCEATVFPTVPAFLAVIAPLASRASWPPSLRKIVSAGARLAPEVAARFRASTGLAAHVFYGASECGGITFDRTGDAAESGTVGLPVDGVTIRLIPVPGEPGGQVTVRSRALGCGMIPRDDGRLAGETFRSADLGAWSASGEIRLLGRADGLVNVSGKKVQPAEVEIVLKSMPGVLDAAVLGVLTVPGGREILRAVVACERGRLGWAEVAAWCRARLAAHKVPRSIVLVDKLPRTARGKLDHAALSAMPPGPATE